MSPVWRRFGDLFSWRDRHSARGEGEPAQDLGKGARAGVVRTKWLDLDFAEIDVAGRPLRFALTGSSSRKRLRSLFAKEPITLAWIDTFAEGEILFDVGANVGMYTVYAAVMRKAQVYAFEPEALNYAELNKNIYLNELHGQVLGYCVALSDIDKADRLLLSDFGIGISFHDFEENSWTEDKTFAPDWSVRKDQRREQGCVGRRLDSLLSEGLPVPHHIKIDVDGLEHRVIAGMDDVLKQPQLRTVLVEINFDNPHFRDVIGHMEQLGWRYSWPQLQTHRAKRLSIERIETYQKMGKGGLNYIFYKDPFYDLFFDQLFERYQPGEPIDTQALLGSIRL